MIETFDWERCQLSWDILNMKARWRMSVCKTSNLSLSLFLRIYLFVVIRLVILSRMNVSISKFYFYYIYIYIHRPRVCHANFRNEALRHMCHAVSAIQLLLWFSSLISHILQNRRSIPCDYRLYWWLREFLILSY